MAIAAGRGHGPCARCARCTIRPGPRTAMSAIAGGRFRPVTGRLDAFQWQTPVAALPSDRGGAIESSPSRKPCWRPRAGPSCSSRQRTSSRRRSRLRRPSPRHLPPRPRFQRLRRPPSRTMRLRRLPPPRRLLPRRPPPKPPPPTSARSVTRAGRTGPKPAGPLVPFAAGYSEGRSSPHSGRDSPHPGARRSRGRRRWPGGRIRGTNRPAQGPGRRLAGIFVTLGRQLAVSERPAFFLPIGAVPDIRCGRFRLTPERCVWSAAIAQLVEHVIRNDGVTGSSPVCGTIPIPGNIRPNSFPSNRSRRRCMSEHDQRRATQTWFRKEEMTADGSARQPRRY